MGRRAPKVWNPSGGVRRGMWFGVLMVFLGIGGVLLGVWGRAWWAGYVSEGWPVVEGVVQKSELEAHRGHRSGQMFKAHVVYHFEMEGESRWGSRIAFGYMGTGDCGIAYGLLDRFPVGTRVTVRYDPDEPRRTVLIPGTGLVHPIGLIAGLIVISAGLLLCFAVPALARVQARRGHVL